MIIFYSVITGFINWIWRVTEVILHFDIDSFAQFMPVIDEYGDAKQLFYLQYDDYEHRAERSPLIYDTNLPLK